MMTNKRVKEQGFDMQGGRDSRGALYNQENLE